MRILVVGAGSFSGSRDSLVEALSAAGHEVITEELRPSPGRKVLMTASAVGHYGTQHRRYRARTPAAFRAFSAMADTFCMRHRPDLTIVVQAIASPNFPYVIYTDHVNRMNSDYDFSSPELHVHPSWNRCEEWALRRAYRVFTMGENARRGIIEHYGVVPNRVTTIGAGANIDTSVAEPKAHGTRILFVGREPTRKGLPTLIDAVRQLRGGGGRACSLDVVGVKRRDEPCIRYHGDLGGEALAAMYRNAHIFAMPTRREPYGIAYIEAMAARCVCVGSDIGAIPDILGEAGITVPPRSSEKLTRALQKLLDDPQEWACRSEASYLRSRELTWSRTAWLLMAYAAPAASVERTGQGVELGGMLAHG